MTTDQLTITLVLTATLILFTWARWRYDVVAVAEGSALIDRTLGTLELRGHAELSVVAPSRWPESPDRTIQARSAAGSG